MSTFQEGHSVTVGEVGPLEHDRETETPQSRIDKPTLQEGHLPFQGGHHVQGGQECQRLKAGLPKQTGHGYPEGKGCYLCDPDHPYRKKEGRCTIKNWKACERRIAELLEGVRVPVSGSARGDAPDIEHPVISVEVKARAKLPIWIEDAMRQAESCARDGKIPVVVLHEDSRRYADALVKCRFSKFAELLETKRGKHKTITQQASAQ